MEAEYYTDKSILVFGDTKPWTQNLKELGGRYNPNLKDQTGRKGRKGWIFPRSKESQVMQFVAEANAGLILPLPIQPRSPSLSVAYAPQSLPSNLSIGPKKTNDRKVKETLETRPTSVSFPNLFVGADNLTYQIIMYTVVCPRVNQLVDIQVGYQIINYEVIELEKQEAPFDSIVIAPIEDRTRQSRAVIVNGQWKVEGLGDDHILIFK
jgi:hypothetical protein